MHRLSWLLLRGEEKGEEEGEEEGGGERGRGYIPLATMVSEWCTILISVGLHGPHCVHRPETHAYYYCTPTRKGKGRDVIHVRVYTTLDTP